MTRNRATRRRLMLLAVAAFVVTAGCTASGATNMMDNSPTTVVTTETETTPHTVVTATVIHTEVITHTSPGTDTPTTTTAPGTEDDMITDGGTVHTPVNTEVITDTDTPTETDTDSDSDSGSDSDSNSGSDGSDSNDGDSNGDDSNDDGDDPGVHPESRLENGTSGDVAFEEPDRFWVGGDLAVHHDEIPRDGETVVAGYVFNSETTSDPCDPQSVYHDTVIDVTLNLHDGETVDRTIRLGDVDAGESEAFDAEFDTRPSNVESYSIDGKAVVNTVGCEDGG